MLLATYRFDDRQHLGLVVDDSVRNLDTLVPTGDLIDAITRWDQIAGNLATSGGIPQPIADVELLAPIPRPRRNIFCVGKNYREHADEFAVSGYDNTSDQTVNDSPVPERPVVFTKATTSVIGPDAKVDRHETITKELDYEVELALIIGRPGANIPADRAYAHVWGYTIINDLTARDRQRDHRQWFLGKSLDTFCPMGPFAVNAEATEVNSMIVESRINGELRQSASVSDLIFDIPTLIETISAGLTLESGDIIATGTPAGVGLGFDPPRFLKSGDLIEMSITDIGTLRNTVR